MVLFPLLFFRVFFEFSWFFCDHTMVFSVPFFDTLPKFFTLSFSL